MDGAEYIIMHISMITQYFVDKYNLKKKVRKRYIFTRVTKGMHGIPQ